MPSDTRQSRQIEKVAAVYARAMTAFNRFFHKNRPVYETPGSNSFFERNEGLKVYEASAELVNSIAKTAMNETEIKKKLREIRGGVVNEKAFRRIMETHLLPLIREKYKKAKFNQHFMEERIVAGPQKEEPGYVESTWITEHTEKKYKYADEADCGHGLVEDGVEIVPGHYDGEIWHDGIDLTPYEEFRYPALWGEENKTRLVILVLYVKQALGENSESEVNSKINEIEQKENQLISKKEQIDSEMRALRKMSYAHREFGEKIRGIRGEIVELNQMKGGFEKAAEAIIF
ncbi:Uncharacterised protein [Candidatus Gugararchaeum adminiculabundum]|nr:Uncharacterised protein [Candidatus Gugararchaeum adminiculabundum]